MTPSKTTFKKLSRQIDADYLKRGYDPKEAERIGKATSAKIGRGMLGRAEMARRARVGRERRRR